MNKIMEMRRKLAEIREKAQRLNERDEFGEEEQRQFDAYMAEADRIQEWLERNDRIRDLPQRPDPEDDGIADILDSNRPPAHNRTRPGDSEERALGHYIRTGDDGALREVRASNDTDMNVTTDADGGYTVPTGHFNNVIARRDEAMLPVVLGVQRIPGTGTTVNVPVDNEADGEFVSTAEGSDHDRDAPALDQKAMTLVRYTKKIQLSWELLEDEDSNLLAFIENFVGRGMAKTHNDLLITEVETNGSNLKTTTSATALAVGELEDAVYDDDLAFYLDDTGSVAWVMRPTTYGKVIQLSGDERWYADTSQGSRMPRGLLGYGVAFSNKAEAYGTTGNKFTLFGNWNMVGWRDAGISRFIRDEYSYEAGIELRYQFRTVYKVLQAEAIGYVDHA